MTPQEENNNCLCCRGVCDCHGEYEPNMIDDIYRPSELREMKEQSQPTIIEKVEDLEFTNILRANKCINVNDVQDKIKEMTIDLINSQPHSPRNKSDNVRNSSVSLPIATDNVAVEIGESRKGKVGK